MYLLESFQGRTTIFFSSFCWGKMNLLMTSSSSSRASWAWSLATSSGSDRTTHFRARYSSSKTSASTWEYKTNDKTEVLSKQMFKSTIVQKTKSYIINNEYSMSLERDRSPHIGETQKRSWGVFVSSQLFWFYIFTHNELVTYALPGQAISLLTVTAVPSN